MDGMRELTDAELDSVTGAFFGELFGLRHYGHITKAQGTSLTLDTWLAHAENMASPSLKLTPAFVSGVFGNPDHIS
jgi:hypothetical protein